MMVFITIPWFYPAYKAGGPIQSVANLVNRFHTGIEYRIFCGNTDLNDTPVSGIESGVWTRYNEQTQVWYAAKDNISSTLTDQTELLKPDVIFIIGIFSWHFNIVPLMFCKAAKKIISVRGMLHPGALTQKKWKKKLFLTALKATGKQHKTVFHATDETEKKYIQHIFGNEVNISVAGNFASLLRYSKPPQKQAGSMELISIALISPMKNHLIVLKALSLCRSKITWNIYGPVKDMEYWQECLAEIKLLPENINVVYHGELQPDKKSAVYVHNHVFILPSKSENFGHAFTEAFSAGRPVITGHHTPWNNLQEERAGINTGASPEELVAAIELFAAMDHAEFMMYSEGAGAYAAKHINESDTAKQYQQMFSA